MNNNHVTILEIDAKALVYNINYFKTKLKAETKIMAVIKTNAYGSDAIEVAKIVQNHVDYFAVAYVDEGIALRKAKIKTPILVLHPQKQNLPLLIEHHLEPSLYNFETLETFLKLADTMLLLNYPIHIKFNTGLNRLGFLHSDVDFIISQIKDSKNVLVKSFFSHLAATEDPKEKKFTTNQINTFAYIVKQLYSTLSYQPDIHVLNTSGIINYNIAQFDMVRLGIGLYGFGNNLKETKQLKNVYNLKSIISQIHEIKPGETVGYNRAFVANKLTKSATIPIGHADGLSRKVGNHKINVLINEQKAPIIGNVCMDMIMADVSNINCKTGDEVIIFNNQQMILDIAEASETISYEILTALSTRIKRKVLY